MTSTPPIRLPGIAAIMLMTSCGVCTAARAEAPLQLDPHFHSVQQPYTRTLQPPAPAEESERPLFLSSGLTTASAEPALTVLRDAETSPPPSATSGFLRTALRFCAVLSMLLLGLHLLHEWLRVLRLRVLRPPRTRALEHARWPSISILIPARGDAASQIARLQALPGIDFDYPPDCIHFVPMFDPAETEVAAAVAELSRQCSGRIHPLAMMAGPNTNLAASLHAAVAHSIGTALIVLDQELPLSRDWLRHSVTPLLDPGVGCVLTRAVVQPTDGALSARLELLADQADTLLATQSDALRLLLCGKARIRALRRQALKSLSSPDLQQAPDGASLALAMTRLGWQSSLLGEITRYRSEDLPDVIRAPRLHPVIALQSMRLAGLLLDPRIPAGARRQGGAAFFSAALPLIWLANLGAAIALYFSGELLMAGLAISLCAASSFDPHGHPGPAFRIAAAARMAGVREEIRLLPLSWLGFVRRILEGLHQLALKHRETRREHPGTVSPAALMPSEAGAQA